ncbi:MAG: TrkH family potassium uptake protein [Candidatus Muirbacterium halophilum]|nr:TrkH family potassium uptake protein [Candidatus Muirbacterium halophilum]MCK9475809.1 TrkH family potassium uptake protein [Candidatus Muirbacterium halophilum]
MFKKIAKNPALSLILSFLIVIIIGSCFLKLPGSHTKELSWVDAFFTATSATCVTGLIVKDTPVDFTLQGQIIILLMIQLGGIGIMTFSMAFAVLLGKKLNFESKALINRMIDYDRPGYTVLILKKVLTVMIIFEIIGAILLGIFFNINGVENNLFFTSIFHSISAFCNAGFSTFSNSLANFSNIISINLIIMILIITGGLGFFVIIEIYSFTKKKLTLALFVRKLSVQVKIVLYVTIILILTGTLLFFVLEKSNVLNNMSNLDKFIASLFQSVTTRTAGFNTINIGGLSRATLLIFMVFMFVGAGPGGTAGGIKITTLYIFIKSVFSMVNSYPEVRAFGRKIPDDIVRKATAVFFISIILNFTAITLLCITEDFELKDIMFETVSAFGTVGLSTGITPFLSDAGRIIIILLMFVGRLGPVTLAIAISKQYNKSLYSLPEEKVMIG